MMAQQLHVIVRGSRSITLVENYHAFECFDAFKSRCTELGEIFHMS